MKISIRIILITFVIVVLVSVSSAFIYYSISTSIIVSQNIKTLLYNSNDFVFEYEQASAHFDEEFSSILSDIKTKDKIKLDTLDIDFFFKLNEDNKIDPNSFICKSNILFNYQPIELEKFLNQNPGTILQYKYTGKNETYFYGKIINEKFIDDISKRIKTDLAVYWGDKLLGFSNKERNLFHASLLGEVFKELRFKNNFDVSTIETNNLNFFAAKYEVKSSMQNISPLTFIIYSTSSDIQEFANTIRTILSVTILTGILLSLIVTVLFTSKFRKQLSMLVDVAEASSKGNLDLRVENISHDEIGTLANSFNKMLDEISRKEMFEKKYSEFVSLINKYSDLNELSREALKSICSQLNIQFGILYLYKDKLLQPVATEGINKSVINPFEENSIYSSVVLNYETIEFNFKENNPILKASSLELPIKYMLIKPIVYNQQLVAVIELICEHTIDNSPSNYLNVITEQLGIGLNNALSVQQLKDLIAELKNLNENIQKQNEMITGQNKELSALHLQLKQKAEELEKERQKALELSDIKSQFLANMSHELKTPLSSIIGLTELILNDNSTIPANKHRLTIVFKNSKKLLEMINNILEYSKIDNNKTQLYPTIFLCSKLVDDLNTFFSFYEGNEKINFIKSFQNNTDYLIKADKDKLEHILTNLLSNAFKFTESGTIEIVLSNLQNDLVIEVNDTGIGISEDETKFIFNQFERINSTEKKYRGAGLGLAICKRYAELMGGEIVVRSKKGIGSSFKLTLKNVILDFIPINTINREVLQHQENKISNNLASINDSDKKILVVDDDVDILFTVGEIIKNMELKTVFAKNGKEALAILSKENIDLILLDIMMPELDGFETLKNIRNNERTKNIYVIALTAYAMLDDKQIIEQSGFDDVITKPVDANNLKMKINQALLKCK